MSEKKEAIWGKLTAVRADFLAYVAGLDEMGWETAVFTDESTDPWNVSDVVRHLADSEWGMTGLMMNIQSGKGGVPGDFDRERWNSRSIAKRKDKTPADLLAEMAQNRQRLFAFLDTLTDDDWAKEGRHASLNIYSIEQICHIIADHESGHLQNIREAVGG